MALVAIQEINITVCVMISHSKYCLLQETFCYHYNVIHYCNSCWEFCWRSFMVQNKIIEYLIFYDNIIISPDSPCILGNYKAI